MKYILSINRYFNWYFVVEADQKYLIAFFCGTFNLNSIAINKPATASDNELNNKVTFLKKLFDRI